MTLLIPSPILLGALERDHVGEAAPRRYRDVGEVVVARVLVRDVLHEEQREDVGLVLGRVHSAAQLVAALPERGVEVGFAEGHGGGGVGWWGRWVWSIRMPGRLGGVKEGQDAEVGSSGSAAAGGEPSLRLRCQLHLPLCNV